MSKKNFFEPSPFGGGEESTPLVGRSGGTNEKCVLLQCRGMKQAPPSRRVELVLAWEGSVSIRNLTQRH